MGCAPPFSPGKEFIHNVASVRTSSLAGRTPFHCMSLAFYYIDYPGRSLSLHPFIRPSYFCSISNYFSLPLSSSALDSLQLNSYPEVTIGAKKNDRVLCLLTSIAELQSWKETESWFLLHWFTAFLSLMHSSPVPPTPSPTNLMLQKCHRRVREIEQTSLACNWPQFNLWDCIWFLSPARSDPWV